MCSGQTMGLSKPPMRLALGLGQPAACQPTIQVIILIATCPVLSW